MDQRPRLQGAGDTALDFFTPISLVVWLTVFSPIIISFLILSLSLVFQNFKGLLYLGLLLLCSVLRVAGLYAVGSQPFDENRGAPDCRRVKYNNYGNNSFSSFVFAFTLLRACRQQRSHLRPTDELPQAKQLLTSSYGERSSCFLSS